MFINNIFIDNDSNYIDNVCGMDVYRHVVLGVNYKRQLSSIELKLSAILFVNIR